MKPLQYISVKLALCLITGILIGNFLNLSTPTSSLFLGVFLILLTIAFFKAKRNSVVFGVISSLTVIVLGLFLITNSNPKNNPNHYTNKEIKNQNVWHIKIIEILKPTIYSHKYLAEIININTTKATGKLLLNIQTDTPIQTLHIDDEILVNGTLETINKPLNPHQFNYSDYMNGLGVFHQLQCKDKHYFLTKNRSVTSRGIAANARNKITTKLEAANFDKGELSIIKALLLGQRNDIDPEIVSAYKNAGAIHILALSGLHIGVLLLLLQFLLKPLERLPKGKTIKLVVIVFLLWGFALLAGLSDSLVRAVTMFTFVAYALYLNRPTSTFNILSLSLFFILLSKPNLLFSVGLQMSYAAVFSIVLFIPIFQKLWQPKYWINRKIWQLMSVSIAAQLGVLPISLFYFHQFPSLFFISNLLIIPFLGLILGMGILIIFLALCNILPAFLASWYNTVIYIMNSIIKWVSTQETFLYSEISFDKPQLILGYVILLFLVSFLAKKSFKGVAILLSSVILFQGWVVFSNWKASNKEELILLHQTRNTILIHQLGKKATTFSSRKLINEKILIDYGIAERIDSIKQKELQNSYRYKNDRLIVVDSLGIYPKELTSSIVLLTQSPKINLNRFIEETNPKVILADGSNYKSAVSRWKKTCAKRKVPFYYTGTAGFYTFD